MTKDGGTRWIALLGATSLHVAVGLALLSAAANGVPYRGRAVEDSGRAILVDLTPVVRAGDHAGEAPAASEGGRATRQEASRPASGERLASPAPARSAAGPADRSDSPSEARAEATRSTADLPSAEMLAYRARLQTHLARFRIYPPAARGAGEQGVAVLHFIMDRQGRVIDVWIESSSGVAAIDNETVAAVMRAQPLPVFPADWPERLSISLPVAFRLG
ncbi:hypothetical protein C5708_04530 [Caulobacter sp. CCUG 60055]|uniref:energy transducer TonB family protein n=1 Tax=Caulobacter sp. CCUG 60055 TaxID=2100090 RepID=UPI001FA77D79|nr:energy transducer TonB [Caulobacter sp. CCUG 60055]MBQ1542714.1 energy transducer TonB [Caulobacteraceae bacterium]MCI3179514.1 hypothetical protein [Caulobacter sp. CCUG 60055]